MLMNPTAEKLQELRLTGMQSAYHEQRESTEYDSLTFDERFGLLVDREHTERYNRRLTTRLRKAKLRLTATVEDIDYRHGEIRRFRPHPRGLDKSLMLSLADCAWIRQRHNIIITGPAGAGKTYPLADRHFPKCR